MHFWFLKSEDKEPGDNIDQNGGRYPILDV